MDHPENDAQYAGLAVNKGIEQPPIVNPYLKKMRTAKRRSFTASEYVEGIVKGDTSILSQAVTLVESNLYEHQTLAQEVIEKCLPHACDSVRVGITGVPGAGKSTSKDTFGKVAYWATKPVWKNYRYTPTPLSALHRRQAR